MKSISYSYITLCSLVAFFGTMALACDESADSLPSECPPGVTAEEAQEQGLTCIPAGDEGLDLPTSDAQVFPDVGDDVQDPPIPDTDEGFDVGDDEGDTDSPPPVENCINEEDDDGDGQVDCKDDDCVEHAACVEVLCNDNHDNDFDGLKDCEDPDCSWHTECGAQTCNDFYLCLTEDGCDCNMDVSCPEPGTPEYTACQTVCVQDEVCSEGCSDQLSDEYKGYLATFQLCGSALCNNIDEDSEYGECLQENCLVPYAYCFFNGPSECADFYFVCAKDCGVSCGEDDEACAKTCIDECINALSPAAYVDAVNWDTCRFDLCAGDDGSEIASDACYYIGGFFACVDVAQSCVPDYLLQGSGTCGSVGQCLIDCESYDDSTCVLGCLEQVGENNAFEVANLFSCVISVCGPGEDELTPTCTSEALTGACNSEWLLCAAN